MLDSFQSLMPGHQSKTIPAALPRIHTSAFSDFLLLLTPQGGSTNVSLNRRSVYLIRLFPRHFIAPGRASDCGNILRGISE